jgi:diaminohydroxyphosphoribosylaminopyrimidine deaminase/5-amino-6-(5-phosphoribosylamino)uracil reductase
VRRPAVTLKLATTLDGRIALANGASQWITGPEARAHVHRMRAAHDAVLTGIGTVLADNPLLTARFDGNTRQPLRVVLDTRGRLPLASALVQSVDEAGLMVLHGGKVTADWRSGLITAGASPVAVAENASNGHLEIEAALDLLSSQGIATVMVEAGAGVAGAVLGAGVVDRIEWFRAPMVFGGDGLAVSGPLGLTAIDQARCWVRVRAEACGEDLWETYEARAGQSPAGAA